MTRPDRGIRVKVFAVLPDAAGTRHLVWRGTDTTKQPGDFHRLLGGHLELGEDTVEGVRREVLEETGRTLEDAALLGVLENRYVFEGAPGHEVVFVFSGRLDDPDVVPPDGGWLSDDGEPIWAEWRPFDDADVDLPLHPDGLAELLRRTGVAPRDGGRGPVLDPAIAARLTRTGDGLVPAVVQQHDTGEVLMLGWMDDVALARTLTTGRATYWSRSRQAYWVKGDTSGHAQHVKDVRLDCDGDTLLVRVDQVGAACHTGDRTCFDADLLLSDG